MSTVACTITQVIADDSKLKLCPPPSDLTAKEKALWADIVRRSPLDVFGLAERRSLCAYVKLSTELELALSKKMTRNVLARVARLSSTLRGLSLRLNLKELKRIEKRSAIATIENEEARILEAALDPSHPRWGLYGSRVTQ